VGTPTLSKLIAVCEPLCSLEVGVIGPAISAVVIEMRERGAGAVLIHRRATELGYTGSVTSMQRHLKHLRPAADDLTPELPPGQKASDLEILDAIVTAGYRNAKSWKPTIKDTMDAMRLKMQMTGNSAFQDMLDAMERGLQMAEAPEAPEAVAGEDEVAQAGIDS
jgi:hypothetical protein